MGTYSTDGMLTRELEEQILVKIVRPTLTGLRKEGMEYRGFIFFGLMLTNDGPKVLEYNCRLGDPETQAILLRADFDFAATCMDATTGKLDPSQAKWSPGASVCVVMASEGYPANPVLGKPIGGLDEADKVSHVAVFHAGTKREGENYYTSGGRILGIAAVGESLEAAARSAYDAASRITIPGAHYRKDIGVAGAKYTKMAGVRANG
jgi:phosphoribosylamine--glycine ligase